MPNIIVELTQEKARVKALLWQFDYVVRAQAERVLRDLDLVQREEFEAVKAMAQKAREENDRLKERIAQLEAALGNLGKR